MRGVLLAGGSGTRLSPLTDAINKHLLPVGDVPMIFHNLRQLAECGVRDVLLITGPTHIGQFAQTLGEGTMFGVRLYYRVQSRPGGIAQGLALAEHFAEGDDVILLLGDNMFSRSVVPYFGPLPEGAEAKILLKAVHDPERYGVAEIQGDKILSICEKPTTPRSNLAVVGAYQYRNSVFDVIRTISPSARGELEISDVNAAYLTRGQLCHAIYDGDWIDAGTHESYAIANQMMAHTRTTAANAA